VQHYFPTRDALLGAAFLEVNSTAVAKARAVAANGDGPVAPWRRLALIVEQFTALDRWGLWVEFWAAARHRDELRAVLEAAYGAWREPIVEAIEEGVATGEFAPRFTPGEISGAFVALIDGLGIQRELGLDWLSPQRTRDLVLGALGSALRIDA
jgi:AcrR family transcriptional regulator